MATTLDAHDQADPATAPTARPRAGRPARVWARDLGVLALLTAVLMIPVLELWRAEADVPMVARTNYSFDAPFYSMLTKDLIDHGTYLTNPDLAWPVGQELYDLPHGADNLQFLTLLGLGAVLRDPGRTVNAYYLLTYVLVSLSAFAVLRRLGISRLSAGVAALLYTFLPYHLLRSTAHLLLSGYFMVPIACLLILAVLSDRPPLISATPRDGRRRLDLRSGRSWLVLAACAGVASTGPYYTFFTLVLLASAVALDFLRRHSRAALASAGMIATAIVTVSALNLTPTLLYWARHGDNPETVKRYATETELFGLKISGMLLPSPGHRIETFDDIATGGKSRLQGEDGQALGLVGAAGFIGLLAFTLAIALRRGKPRGVGSPPRGEPGAPSPPELARRLGVLTVLAVLFGTVSGFSLLLSGTGFVQFRSWNRIVVFIAFFALAAVALALDRLFAHLPRTRGRPIAAVALATAVLAVGLLDQTSPRMLPPYERDTRRWESDQAFIDSVAARVPADAALYQFPFVPFPEAEKVGDVGPYDEALDYVHGGGLAFSYGGMQGRQDAWQERLLDESDWLDRLVAVGYDGTIFERDAGDRIALLEAYVATTLDAEPLVSADGRKAFYDLDQYARGARQRLGEDGLAVLRHDTLSGD